jgi:hypothetical protein
MTSFWFKSIEHSTINQQEHIELGLPSADTSQALGRGMDGKKLGDPSQSVREAINRLMTWLDE